MLYHAKGSPVLSKYFPVEEKEVEKMPRPYIANVIYTICGETFRKWVEKKINERNHKLMEEQNMAIEMDPEVLKAFRASTYVSGKS